MLSVSGSLPHILEVLQHVTDAIHLQVLNSFTFLETSPFTSILVILPHLYSQPPLFQAAKGNVQPAILNKFFYVIFHRSDSANSAASTFVVDPQSGSVKTASTYERDGSSGVSHYILTVQATDSGSPQMSVTSTLSVSITDTNEYPPEFADKVQVATVSEGVSVGDTVFTLGTVTDSDATTLSVSYSIVSGNAGAKFMLTSVPASGTTEVQLAAAIDPDDGDPVTYTLELQASDGTLTGSMVLLVKVTPQNDNTPGSTMVNATLVSTGGVEEGGGSNGGSI